MRSGKWGSFPVPGYYCCQNKHIIFVTLEILSVIEYSLGFPDVVVDITVFIFIEVP